MSTVLFDTHQEIRAITESGLDDNQAEAIVTSIGNSMIQNLATISDITATKADTGVLKTDMRAVKADIVVLKADVAALKTDVATLKIDVAALKSDMLVLKSMVGLIIVAEVLPLLKSFLA